MPTRSNACSEVVRFWLQSRHGHLIDEAIPVPVPYALSDIDLVAYQPRGESVRLPDDSTIGPRLIVETKDEHDWEPLVREFGQLLRADLQKMDGNQFIRRGAKGVKFTMLRREHYERAVALFGTDDSDRLFVVHALDPVVRLELANALKQRRIHVLVRIGCRAHGSSPVGPDR